MILIDLQKRQQRISENPQRQLEIINKFKTLVNLTEW